MEVTGLSEAVWGRLRRALDPQHQDHLGICERSSRPGPTPSCSIRNSAPHSTPRDSDPVWGPCSTIPKHAWKLEEKIRERERAGRKHIQRTEQLNKALKSWIWTEKIRVTLEPSSSPYKGPAATTKYHLPPEGIGAPWTVDSRARAGNAQSESGTSCYTREQRN